MATKEGTKKKENNYKDYIDEETDSDNDNLMDENNTKP